MTGRGRGRRNRGGQRRPTVRSQMRRVESMFHNRVAFKGRADPPAIEPTPWNHVVLVLRETADEYITDGQIASGLSTQLGVSIPTNGFLIRLQSIRVWEVAGNDVQLTLYDLDTWKQRNTTADVCGRNRWAHAGMRYSADQANNALNMKSGSQNQVAYISTNAGTGSTEKMVIYIDLLWKSPDGLSLPELMHARALESSFERLSFKQQQ